MLSHALNKKILSLAPRFKVVDYQIDFEALKACKGKIIPVWSGGSEKTIYGNPLVNYAFRAWHDSVPIQTGQGFTLPEETIVSHYQAGKLGGTFGEIINIEVIDQIKFFQKTNNFLDNQVEFCLKLLRERGF